MNVQSTVVTTTTITLTMDEVKELLRERHAERIGVPAERVEVRLSGRIGYDYVDDSDANCLSFSLTGSTETRGP